MSDDLTRRIGDMLLDVLMADIPNLRTGTFANLQRAIASLIAEERASARREGMEEAARVAHRKGAEIELGAPHGTSHPCASTVYSIARAIRSLAKEADNGQ